MILAEAHCLRFGGREANTIQLDRAGQDVGRTDVIGHASLHLLHLFIYWGPILAVHTCHLHHLSACTEDVTNVCGSQTEGQADRTPFVVGQAEQQCYLIWYLFGGLNGVVAGLLTQCKGQTAE